MYLCIESFTFFSLFGMGVGSFVPSFIYIEDDVSRVNPFVPVVISVPSIPSVPVISVEMTVVFREPVVVISVVVMPVVGTPGVPVYRVVSPVPGGAPYYIVGHVYEPYYRPCGNFNVSGPYNCRIVPVCPSGITGIGCLGIIGFYYVIPSVKCFVTYKLYLYRTVAETLNGEYGYVLTFVPVENCLKHNCMNIPVNIVKDLYIIDVIIVIQVKIVDPGVLIVQAPFKPFKGFRFLEQFHYCIKIEVITRQTQIFIRIVLRHHCSPGCNYRC